MAAPVRIASPRPPAADGSVARRADGAVPPGRRGAQRGQRAAAARLGGAGRGLADRSGAAPRARQPLGRRARARHRPPHALHEDGEAGHRAALLDLGLNAAWSELRAAAERPEPSRRGTRACAGTRRRRRARAPRRAARGRRRRVEVEAGGAAACARRAARAAARASVSSSTDAVLIGMIEEARRRDAPSADQAVAAVAIGAEREVGARRARRAAAEGRAGRARDCRCRAAAPGDGRRAAAASAALLHARARSAPRCATPRKAGGRARDELGAGVGAGAPRAPPRAPSRARPRALASSTSSSIARVEARRPARARSGGQRRVFTWPGAGAFAKTTTTPPLTRPAPEPCWRPRTKGSVATRARAARDLEPRARLGVRARTKPSPIAPARGERTALVTLADARASPSSSGVPRGGRASPVEAQPDEEVADAAARAHARHDLLAGVAALRGRDRRAVEAAPRRGARSRRARGRARGAPASMRSTSSASASPRLELAARGAQRRAIDVRRRRAATKSWKPASPREAVGAATTSARRRSRPRRRRRRERDAARRRPRRAARARAGPSSASRARRALASASATSSAIT